MCVEGMPEDLLVKLVVRSIFTGVRSRGHLERRWRYGFGGERPWVDTKKEEQDVWIAIGSRNIKLNNVNIKNYTFLPKK